MGVYDFSFYDVISRNAHCFKETVAWYEVDDRRTKTFHGIRKDVDLLACGLQRQGITRGDRIGVLGKNSLEFFLIYGAAAALGAVVLPVNWRLSADEVVYNLNDCSPRCLFVGEDFQGTIEGVKGNLPSVEHYYNLTGTGGRFSHFNSLMTGEEDFRPVPVATDDPFVIIHTAAVEGRPRGAVLSHGNVLAANLHFHILMQVTAKDVHLNFLPLFHVGGLFMATTSFHAGAMNVNMGKFDPSEALGLIQEKGVSLMFDFSPILASILDEQEKRGGKLDTLRAVAGLESPETIERYERVTGGTFYCMYGQTETSCVATFGPYRERPGAAGKPLPLAEVTLVDEYDRPVPTGQVGEITLRGPMVFKGYWNLPEDTAYTLREGRHHTGDLGRFDEEGFLWYAGRKAEKELIKPGGENVYPAEVEKVILEHPAVELAVVFGVPDPKWKEGIKAVCQLKQGFTLQPNELMEFVGNRIARYKKPQYVEFVTDCPLLESGLPDRAKVKDLYGGGKP
jgi:acyl-CoA synthetase (AMP-forming)/AMP-acid ligase II